MNVPDGVLVAVVGLLGGVLGFLARTVMDHRTRIAILEEATTAVSKMESKVDSLIMDMADLKATVRERFK